MLTDEQILKKLDAERQDTICERCGRPVDRLTVHRDEERMSWVTTIFCHGEKEIANSGRAFANSRKPATKDAREKEEG